jgi:hypothetical protein
MNIFTDPPGSAEHTWGTSGLADSSSAAASVNTTTTAAVASVNVLNITKTNVGTFVENKIFAVMGCYAALVGSTDVSGQPIGPIFMDEAVQ